MKKAGVVFVIFLVFAVITYSESATIYNNIKNIMGNPSTYIAVIGKNAKVEEMKAASELIGFLGIRKSNFDSQVSTNSNLVVVGIAANNQKVADLIGQTSVNGILIKAVNNNLVVAGSSITDVNQAIDMIKDYEKNKVNFMGQEFYSTNLFGPIKSIFSNMLFVYILIGLIVLGSSTAIVKNRRRAGQKPITRAPLTIQHPAYIQLKNYVVANLRKGYSEQQIRNVLIRTGWKNEVLDAVFNEIRRF